MGLPEKLFPAISGQLRPLTLERRRARISWGLLFSNHPPGLTKVSPLIGALSPPTRMRWGQFSQMIGAK
jgi:hypothetical protein